MHRQHRGTRTFLCALSALLLLLAGLDATAQLGLGFSNPTQLAGTGRNRSPIAATDGAGHWLVAWDHSDVIGSGQEDDIYLARSTDNGLTWTAAVPLNTNAASDTGLDWWPDLATDGNGHWVAVWRSNDSLGGTLGNDFDILVATSNDNGLSWTNPAPLYTGAATDTTDEWWPRIATDSLGHWVIAWDGQDVSGDSDVFTACSSDNGATWTPPVPLNPNAATDTAWDTELHVTADGLGHWVAVWESRTPEGGPYGTDDDLYVARSTDNGLTWSPPAALNSNAATDSGRDIAPDLATDRAGHWTVVWESNDDHAGTLGTDYDILVARSEDNGTTWTDPAPLNTYASGDVGNDWVPRLSTDGAGRWITTWSFDPDNNGSLGADPVGYLATSNDNGATWSYPVLLSEGSTPDGWNPHLATDGAGHWVATWMSFGGGTEDFAIYVASLDASTDTDWDGLSNDEETRDLDPLTPGIQNPFDPAVYDSTGDDGSTVPDGICDRNNDWDGDGVPNGQEFTFGSNPADPNDTVDLPQAHGSALGLLALSLSLAAARALRKRGTP